MTSATTEHAIPSLDELYRMTAVPDQRTVIRDVDWAFYEQLLDSIPPKPTSTLITTGRTSSSCPATVQSTTMPGYCWAQLAEAVAQVLRISYKGLGQTTWKRKELARGLESDECYFFLPEKLAAAAKARARRSMDIADYPNPDLSIEVDISRPRDRPAGNLCRLARYRALAVRRRHRAGHHRAARRRRLLSSRRRERVLADPGRGNTAMGG